MRGEYLEDRPRDLQPPLDRLIRVRIRANGDGARLVTRPREFAGEKLRGVRLGKQSWLEVKAGR